MSEAKVPASTQKIGLHEAYEACRQIARREAKNFYYAFLALPRRKSDAMCAVYAFMRRADDISDDESRTTGARRKSMEEWTAAWHAAQSGGDSNDPVFIALRDTQQRFGIPAELLDQLVAGTAMDLEDEEPVVGGTKKPGSANSSGYLREYESFEDLYQYSYLVASVVGLVCIRIFGYKDERAEKLAEETGIAFQLTNILRDVREDAERGRMYLPRQDMEKFSVDARGVAVLKDGKRMTLNQRELLEFEAQRARTYYASARELLPLINADSRPALWVLVTIYRTLLDRIEAKNFDVFTERVKVKTWTKLVILFRGLAKAIYYRLMRVK